MTSLFEALAVDDMQTMHLGVMAFWALSAMWALLMSDPWSFELTMPQEAAHQQGALCIRHELHAWYKREQKHGNRVVHEIPDVSLADMGTRNKRVWRPKAVETGTFVEFAVQLLQKFPNVPQGPAWIAAGQCLVSYLRITRQAAAKLELKELQGLMDATLRFSQLAKKHLAWTSSSRCT